MPDIPGPFPRSLQWEDLFLFVWLGLVEPLLYKLFGSLLGDVQPWNVGEHPNPALGLLFSLAAIGGLIVIATRAPGENGREPFSGGVSGFARLPMLVTLMYMILYGFSSFGADVPMFIACGLIVFFFAASMLFARLPVLDIPIRRILVTPMIILSSWNFAAIMRIFFQGANLPAVLSSPALRDPNSSLGFILGILFAAVVVFYLVFILAPRQIAYPGGAWRDWIARFAVYMLGAVLNLGWLPFL